MKVSSFYNFLLLSCKSASNSIILGNTDDSTSYTMFFILKTNPLANKTYQVHFKCYEDIKVAISPWVASTMDMKGALIHFFYKTVNKCTVSNPWHPFTWTLCLLYPLTTNKMQCKQIYLKGFVLRLIPQLAAVETPLETLQCSQLQEISKSHPLKNISHKCCHLLLYKIYLD